MNKKLFLTALLALMTLISFAQEKPRWIYKKPKPSNNTYLYVVEAATGSTEREARSQAIARVLFSTAMRLGIPIDVNEINRAVQNGESFEVISSQFNIPINKVCEFGESNKDGYRVYLLCQVAKAGNITVIFVDFNDCYNIVKDHSRDWKAVGLSLIPGGGWGELYKGHKWGWGIVGSEVALVGGGLACYFIGLHEKSIMDNPNETINEKELASRRYDNVYDLQPWLYGGALFIHGLNIIVAYVIDDKNQNHNLTFVPTFMPTNNTLTVGIGINYKF